MSFFKFIKIKSLTVYFTSTALKVDRLFWLCQCLGFHSEESFAKRAVVPFFEINQQSVNLITTEAAPSYYRLLRTSSHASM